MAQSFSFNEQEEAYNVFIIEFVIFIELFLDALSRRLDLFRGICFVLYNILREAFPVLVVHRFIKIDL